MGTLVDLDTRRQGGTVRPIVGAVHLPLEFGLLDENLLKAGPPRLGHVMPHQEDHQHLVPARGRGVLQAHRVLEDLLQLLLAIRDLLLESVVRDPILVLQAQYVKVQESTKGLEVPPLVPPARLTNVREWTKKHNLEAEQKLQGLPFACPHSITSKFFPLFLFFCFSFYIYPCFLFFALHDFSSPILCG